jgi:hypothetical protein
LAAIAQASRSNRSAQFLQRPLNSEHRLNQTAQGQITSVVPPAPIDLQLDSPPEVDWLLWQADKIEAQAKIIKMSFILPPSKTIEFALLLAGIG